MIPSIIDKSWHSYLLPLFQSKEMEQLRKKILPSAVFYPEAKNIFRVFSMPLNKIKVVILGQDPYPQPGQANGLAFAVNENTNMPASLKIIANEVMNDIPLSLPFASDWKTLEHWHNQGVFLLNTALTVKKGVPRSHSAYWKPFIEGVISTISAEVTPIWLLWGNDAIGKEGTIRHAELFKVNIILKAQHPASETYPGNRGKFSGCKHFSKVNDLLLKEGQNIINW